MISGTVAVAQNQIVQPAFAITFGSTRNLSDNDGNSFDPQVDVSSSNVYTVWADNTKGDGDTFFRRSSDAGNSFHSIVDLSNNVAGEATDQKVTKIGNNVYVVWSENGDVFFKRSTDNGAHFGSISNLSNNDGDSFNPQMDLHGSNVYIVWQDKTPGNFDILFRKGVD